MKAEHLAIIADKLPGAIPQIQQVLKDNGLGDFLIKHLELMHDDDDPCHGNCTDEQACVQVLQGTQFVWACRP